MINIIITAGGTIESIDGVRSIANTSTGKLSACIYEALAEAVRNCKSLRDRSFTVHYVVSKTAVRPEKSDYLPIIFYPATDVKSVEAILKKLMTDYTADYFIHGMAVSDFKKGYLIEREKLSQELACTLKSLIDCEKGCSFEILKEKISQVLENPEHTVNPLKKISSKSELILSLVKTPKLIEKIKVWNPDIFLVGFKLLKNVSEERLIMAGKDLADKNGCNLVLVNDLSKISEGRHFGLLIKNGKVIGRYDTKEAIARGIAEHILRDIKKY
jgi:phosphopantothenate--cysteine ligase